MKTLFKKNRLSTKLFLSISLALVITLTLFIVFLTRDTTKFIVKLLNTDQETLVNAVFSDIEYAHKENTKLIQKDMGIAQLALNGNFVFRATNKELGVRNQLTGETSLVRVGDLLLNGKSIVNASEYVDQVSNLTKGLTTVFVVNDIGLIRVATSVKDDNGQRATFSYIPNNSPVYKSIANGKEYLGLANVMGKWIMSYYKPLFNSQKQVVGALFVGQTDNIYRSLSEKFSNIKVGKDNYFYVLDTMGNLIIHPLIEGKNVMETTDENGYYFFKEICNAKNGKLVYNWKNTGETTAREKTAYFRYYAPLKWILVFGVYKDEFMTPVKKQRAYIIGFGVLLFIVISLIVYLISINLTKVIKNVVQYAQKISEGDLTQQLIVKRKDEIGDMAAALNNMGDNLKNIIGQIIVGAHNVSSASSQFSTATIQIAKGANEQAASTEEISASIEQMNSTIQQNTDNSSQTDKIATNAAKGIIDMSEASIRSLDAIRQIAKKIEIINAIAEKTDILAINAAIEAARAGDHGKGFAVVAAEVRKLAETSQKAAVEINELSSLSLQITEDAGNIMSGLIPDIKKTATLVQEITASSTEQASGALQIAKAIEQLSQVTQQNSAAAEEMSSTAEKLASQAESLQEVISFFETGNSIIGHSVPKNEKKSIYTVAKPVNKTKKINLTESDSLDKAFETF